MEMSASSKKIFLVTIPILVVFVVVMVILKFIPHTSCHDDPAEQINIVFDKTKYYSPTQAHSVDETLVELLTRAADDAEINLFYVTRDAARPYLVLNECKPSTHGNPLLVNVEDQQNNFRRIIINEIKKKIDLRLQYQSPAPILESLATISRERIITSKLERQKPIEFDIYSDMVQDSKNVSLVARPRSGAANAGADGKICANPLRRTSGSFNETSADARRFFSDVPVHVYGIHRDPSTSPRYPGERCVRMFWEPIFPHLTWMTL
jgi:hypothetical protein